MKDSWDSRLLQWSGFVMAGFLAAAFIVGGGHLDVPGPRAPEHLVQGAAKPCPPAASTKVGG